MCLRIIDIFLSIFHCSKLKYLFILPISKIVHMPHKNSLRIGTFYFSDLHLKRLLGVSFGLPLKGINRSKFKLCMCLSAHIYVFLFVIVGADERQAELRVPLDLLDLVPDSQHTKALQPDTQRDHAIWPPQVTTLCFLKVLSHDFLMGIGARLAPACSHTT